MDRRDMLVGGLATTIGLAGSPVAAFSVTPAASAQPESRPAMTGFRTETDSLGEVEVPADKLWGAQTQRSLEHFSIGKDLIPREMITAYAILKKAAANANHAGGRLDDQQHELIVQVCDEILAGQHHDMFPLHVWMTGSGTQFNMNVNEVISNRCCQIAGTPLGSKTPVHPNDHVNMSQSSNDSFPSAMYIAAAISVKQRLIPAVRRCATRSPRRPTSGRTSSRSAAPTCRTRPRSRSARNGPAMRACLTDNLERLEDALKGVYRLALGGTAVGTGINAAPGFAEAAAARNRQADRPALCHRAQQIHGAGRARCAGAAFRHPAHAGGVALQDRQRHPADVLRARAPASPS